MARATKFSTSESAPSPGAGVTHALREPAASAVRVEIQLAATRLATHCESTAAERRRCEAVRPASKALQRVFSEVDRTLFRNLVGAAAEETYKGI